MTTTAHNLRLIRKHLRLTQAKFAVKFKSTRANIEAYEQGRAKPPKALIDKLNTRFKLEPNQLLDEKLEEWQLNGQNPNSVTSVKLQAALEKIEILENVIKDKDLIIELLKKQR